MQKYILSVVLIILLLGIASMSSSAEEFINLIAPYKASTTKWLNRPQFGSPAYSYWETFENIKDVTNTQESSPDLLNKHSPVERSNQPYHLLQDVMSAPRLKESLSCVTSRSCYSTDFQRGIEKIGNYNQLTNNYKRNYPDSCTSPLQELVLNFYKTSN